MAAIKILIVEDELSLLNIIGRRLKEEGYLVDTGRDGEEGRYFIEESHYDCIILDIMLPVIDGLALLEDMRARGDATPVLLLTARDAVEDRVKGLDTGADDYLVKPFSFEELLARVRALLRRRTETCSNTLSIADLELDINSHMAKRKNSTIELTSKEYAILEYLLKNKGRIMTRTQIAEHVWDYDFDYNSNLVDVYIRYLRRKIDDGACNKLIHTIRGSGYVIKEIQ